MNSEVAPISFGTLRYRKKNREKIYMRKRKKWTIKLLLLLLVHFFKKK
jgi:hypothetical protein